MKLLIQREPTEYATTYGTLAIDGIQCCQTLELAIRELPRFNGEPLADWVARWKVKDHTAIPAGIYPIRLRPSPHFGNRLMPHIDDIPGFSEVMIHTGNTIADIEGCVLVGMGRQDVGSRLAGSPRMPVITMSRVAFDPLNDRIKAAAGREEAVTIEIRNPIAA